MSQLSTHIAINAAYGRMFRHENGIIYLYVDNGLAIEDMLEARLFIVQGNNNNMTFSAQKYWGTVKGMTHLALVVQSRLQAENWRLSI